MSIGGMVHAITQLLSISFFVGVSQADFMVFENTLDPGSFGHSASGAILVDPGQTEEISVILDTFTLCIRFQLKVLGSRNHEDRGMVANIGDM